MLNALKSKTSIKFVEIVFENLESIVVPITKVDNLFIEGIKTCLIYQNHFKDFSLQDTTLYMCEGASLSVKFEDLSDLNYKNDTEVLGMFVGNETINNVGERPEILGRIMIHNDISHLSFLDADEKSVLYLAVPWGKQDYYNEYMKVEVDEKRKELDISFSKQVHNSKKEG